MAPEEIIIEVHWLLILEKKLTKFGIKLGLERINEFCDYLGNPQEKMKVILVAGTNGKGSVTAFLASILKEEGYKTGSYYSPHLKKYNERFQINGKMIGDVKLKKYEKMALDYIKKTKKELMMFEALTGIAYRYFADCNCDFAVMEIGMGGRYDATNVAEECISIITNIGIEHSEYLGNSIQSIAKEKAGIMKRGIVITAAEETALGIIRSRADELKLKIKTINNDFFARPVETTDRHTVFGYIGESFYTKLETGLLGRYQAVNASLAIAAAEQLGVEESSIRKGLKNAKNPGRLEIINARYKTRHPKPLIVIDAAHNSHGIKELVINLSIFRYKKLICVFGVMKDKNWQEMVSLLAPKCYEFIVNQINDRRAADAGEVAKYASQFTKTRIVKDPRKSLAKAKKLAKKDDMILVCGSIYMIGKLR